MRLACPPIIFDCKYLNFTLSTSVNDLISRRIMNETDGADADKYLEEYAEYGSERHKKLVEAVRSQFKLTTLEYHSLDGLLGSVGIDKCKLCTYCWNGREE